MENIEKVFIEKVNKLLEKYKVEVESIEESDRGVRGFFYPLTKTIHLNKNNKECFNDYYNFIEVMLHENAHKINDELGLEDVIFEGEKQIHNQVFRDRMVEEYNLYCHGDYNGGVDMDDKRNYQAFKWILSNKVKDLLEFEEIKDIWMREFFEEQENAQEEQEQEEQEQEDNNGGSEKPEEDEEVEEKEEYSYHDYDGEEF